MSKGDRNIVTVERLLGRCPRCGKTRTHQVVEDHGTYGILKHYCDCGRLLRRQYYPITRIKR